ncbi:hypothetical protein BROUX41_000685 [Berkeleyomyces rouxiae]
MGVNGLWQVVQPCARPTNIATLNRKRLAVDASIWIYQFLKGVRDKEGNALSASHVVGFFRRICKLLWFGILPVFVFDGGAPALKRQTIQNRRQRREGRREDATRTAGKLLTVQMQRFAYEEIERQKKKKKSKSAKEGNQGVENQAARKESSIDFQNAVYVDEIGMSPQERLGKRKFVKQDPYHLPDLEGGVGARASPHDPRIMSVEELEEYARQFNSGEEVDLYDFSNIDFDGDFFQSLPAADRYYIINAARLRSRLRMGLSKEQLEIMFPDRMAFSRFQIERVRERNNLTQRLMKELGMSGLDLTIDGGRRIAGEKNREYILVKNDSAEGGWALGVVNRDKDLGKAHKPIDVDALQFEFQGQDGDPDPDDEEDEDFEDVPIEGLNRLPKTQALAARALQQSQSTDAFGNDDNVEEDDEDALFVGGSSPHMEHGTFENHLAVGDSGEQNDIDLAIALSLETQHKAVISEPAPAQAMTGIEEHTGEAPAWKQRAVEITQRHDKPITKFNLNSLNRRANSEVNNPTTKEVEVHDPDPSNNDSDSDSDVDFQQALAMSRKTQQIKPATVPLPVLSMKSSNSNTQSLPFPKLDWSMKKSSVESGKPIEKKNEETLLKFGGGFVPESSEAHEKNGKPANDLPPWLLDNTDIIESLKEQEEAQRRMNANDREHVQNEQQFFEGLHSQQKEIIQVHSDTESEIEFVDVHTDPTPLSAGDRKMPVSRNSDETLVLQRTTQSPPALTIGDAKKKSPESEFEDVVTANTAIPTNDRHASEPADEEAPVQEFEIDDEELFGESAQNSDHDDNNLDDLSDIENEELLIQMAEEADEHARFANQVQNRPESATHDSIETELRQLRERQRKDRRDADEVTETMALQCQALLRLFGIPFITAPMEAEAQCAELFRLGLVDGIITDDSDTFLFGGSHVYKNMFNTNKFVECYITSDFEKEMSLDRNSLISLALLLGSDYTEGLPGVGPVTAVEILSEFPGKDGLGKFKEWWEDVQINNRPQDVDAFSAFRRKFRKAHSSKLFLPASFPSQAVHEAYIRPEVDDSRESFQWGVPDLDGLRKFLMSTIGWNQERTDEVLVPVIRDMNKREREGTQSNITKYFQGGVGVGSRDAFAPRQRVQGSKRMAKAVDKLRHAATGEDRDSNLHVNPTVQSSTKRKRLGTRAQEIEDGNYGNNGDDEGDNGRETAGRRRKASRKAT